MKVVMEMGRKGNLSTVGPTTGESAKIRTVNMSIGVPIVIMGIIRRIAAQNVTVVEAVLHQETKGKRYLIEFLCNYSIVIKVIFCYSIYRGRFIL